MSNFLKSHRYSLFSLLSSFPFSPFSTSPNLRPLENLLIIPPKFTHVQTNPNPNPNLNLHESEILNELSTLLPISYTKPPNPTNLIPPPVQKQTLINPSPDGFLPLEDKLRGIFLLKLKGKSSIENALSNVLGSEEINVNVISRVLDRGNLGGEAMLLFFNWAVDKCGVRDLEVYNVIIKALGRRKYFDFMVGVFQEMSNEGVVPSCDTLMIVLDSFVRARLVSRAVGLFGELGEFGMEGGTEAFNVLLRCLCKRGHVGVANSLLNSMKGRVVFDRVSYNVVIGGWARLGRVSEMVKCLKAMVEDGFCADCGTYSSLIEGLGRDGQVDGAVEIFESLEGEGCRRDVSVYNAMIANYVSVGDFDKCMKYFEEMSRNSCPPDLDTYTKIIGGLMKARKVADALEMFDKMLCAGVVPTTGIITSFIEPLCSYGPPHAAMMLYKSARKHGCNISLTAYKLLLMRLSRFGKCGMLLKLWNEMQESGYPSDMDVYESVVNGLCNNGQLDTAVFVMEEALRKGFCPSRLMYSKLNNRLLAFDKSKTAYKLSLKIRRARANENGRRYWRANGWHF